jgi:hypothetical protein
VASFTYAGSADPIRPDLADAHRRAWRHVALPGTWLRGDERVSVAEETRRARACALCRDRKAALSPHAVAGEHDHAGALPAPLVDAVHRVTTDAARLGESWYRSLVADGLTAEAYVEALGVATLVISVDGVHRALGLPLEPLPDPEPGEPTRVRPSDVVEGEAWVPMQSARAAAALVGLPAGPTPYVLRALSLVPREVEAWTALSGAQYLGTREMRSFRKLRAIDRSQMELLAGRVSALNECFY